MRNSDNGFTLIELMITVAIIGILAAIAYPSYLKQVQKSNRSDAKVALSDVAQRMQRCFTTNSTYDTAAGVCSVVDEVQSGTGVLSTDQMYQVKIAADADLTATTYLLTATPVAGGRQATDDDCTKFTLSQSGVRIAYKGGAVNTDSCW